MTSALKYFVLVACFVIFKVSEKHILVFWFTVNQWAEMNYFVLGDKTWACRCGRVAGSESGGTVPHSPGAAVLQVLQQLRHGEHRLKGHGQGAQRLHKHGQVQQQQREHSAERREAEAEEQVILKRTPLPEVTNVQIWRGEKRHAVQSKPSF